MEHSLSNNKNFDLSEEYYYYHDLAKKMTRCCKLGREISVNEAYYYLHQHCVKCFKDACIYCIKDNRWYIVFFQNVKSWFYDLKSWFYKLSKNNDVLF